MCGTLIAMLAWGSRNLSIQSRIWPLQTITKLGFVLPQESISVCIYVYDRILVAVLFSWKLSYLHPNTKTKWCVLDGRVLRSIKMCQDNQYWSDLKANMIKSLSQNASCLPFLDYILLIFAKGNCPSLN